VPRDEAGACIAERNTAPGGKLPLNTNGGGLSYMHSGMYGMYALQESVRQIISVFRKRPSSASTRSSSARSLTRMRRSA
jgi:acetyl-CoA acetyltransferase